jgi:paraquat-inducible protein B
MSRDRPSPSLSHRRGLEPGKTRIKYKDVDVGQIMSVALAEDGAM